MAADKKPVSEERPGGSRWRLGAWQPLTGGGVAAFAEASVTRTLGFQLLFALLAALAITWSVRQAWFPPFRTALTELPESAAEIRNGRLFWPDTNAVTLGENPQLAVAVDPDNTGELGRSADLQVELHAKEVRLTGLFGEQSLPYPPELQIPLDHRGGPAAWGAWNWVGLVFVAVAVVMALFATWWVTAIVLAPFLWLAALILSRELTLGGAWRLVAAAWLPATMLLVAGIVLYSLNGLRLTGLALATAAHFGLMPLWLLWALVMLPDRMRQKQPKNPFNPESSVKVQVPKKAKKENPFRGTSS